MRASCAWSQSPTTSALDLGYYVVQRFPGRSYVLAQVRAAFPGHYGHALVADIQRFLLAPTINRDPVEFEGEIVSLSQGLSLEFKVGEFSDGDRIFHVQSCHS